MTNEEAKEIIECREMIDAISDRANEALDKAIEALEQEPCEDCVSRADVKEQMIKYGFTAPDMTVTEFVEGCLQPVTPQPKIGNWIPVSERLPERPYGCIVTVMDTNQMTCDEFENIYPDFVGWDGVTWNDADGNSIPFEVIAWQPLPEPYKAESEG